MTLADVESPALTILAVHGLPDEGVDPTSQLDPIRQALHLEPSFWHDHVWCVGTSKMPLGRVVRRLSRREFASFSTDRD